MEKISVVGEDYVKASSLAKKLGYTSDYIGQLARAKKIKATLVGRSWYVVPTSVEEHKRSRYRSTAKKTKTEIKKALNKTTTDETPKEAKKPEGSLRGNQHFYSKAYQPIHYEEDDTEIIPTITAKDDTKELKRLHITPAGAEKLPVKSTSEKYSIEATDLPEIKLKGTLEVVDADPDPQKLSVNSSGRARKVKLSRTRVKPKDRFKHRLQLISRKDVANTDPKVEAGVSKKIRSESRPAKLLPVVVLAGVLGLVLVISLQGVEATTYIVSGQSFDSYKFSTNEIINTYSVALNKIISFKL